MSFSAHSTYSVTHPPANQTETHTATLLSKSVALGCEKAASWQLTKAPPPRATGMKEDGKEVNALRVDSDCSFSARKNTQPLSIALREHNQIIKTACIIECKLIKSDVLKTYKQGPCHKS